MRAGVETALVVNTLIVVAVIVSFDGCHPKVPSRPGRKQLAGSWLPVVLDGLCLFVLECSDSALQD